MFLSRVRRPMVLGLAAAMLAGCGGGPSSGIGSSSFGSGGSGLFGGGANREQVQQGELQAQRSERQQRSTIWDLFENRDDPNTTVEVNKYIWKAALEVLNFLPIETVDPFTGVIVTGYGTPPGGGRAYRATVYVQDPALEARSLKVALMTRGGGAVAPDTVRAVEDAILSRARQLRIAERRL